MWDELLLMSQVCLDCKLLGWWRSGFNYVTPLAEQEEGTRLGDEKDGG